MTFIFLMLGRKMNKEKLVTYANYYMVFKAIFNSIWIMCIASLIVSKCGMSDLTLPFVFCIIYYPYTIIETYVINRKVNMYRKVSCSIWDFFRSWGMGVALNIVGIWFIILLNKNIGKEVFLVVLYLLASIFPWLQIYLSGLSAKASQTKIYEKMFKEKYNLDCTTNMYIYNGKLLKNANAYVTSIFGKKRIMISDYLIENLSEDEVCAILCHEISHCVNFDAESIVMIINFISLLLIVLGYFFGIISMPVILGCIIVISVILVMVLGLMAFRRVQEYRADRYVVDITGDYQVFVNALMRMYDLNNAMKKQGKLLILFGSHPQLDIRVRRLKEYYNERRIENK